MPNRKKDPDPESTKAAAHLYRLAQASAMLRLFRERHGYDASTTEELAAWIDGEQRARRLPKQITPAAEDHAAVNRDNPELARVASRSNPYLSGPN